MTLCLFILGKTQMLLGLHRNRVLENFASENLDVSVAPKAAGRFFEMLF